MNFLLSRSGSLLSFLSKDFVLSQNGTYCCTLRFDNWRGTEFYLQDVRFRISHTGRGSWQLIQGGVEIAHCQRYSGGAKFQFGVHFEGREWRFAATREGLSRCHQVFQGATEVGRIRSKIGWLRNGLDADFDREPSLEIVCFALWLIGIHWIGVAGKVTAVRAQIGI